VNIVVLGGTWFIGPHVVRLLAGRGHDVTVVHRGESEAQLPEAVTHVHVSFAQLPEVLPRLGRSVDVALDMVPYLHKAGHGALHFSDSADRAVVVTSCDVYRAFGRLWRTEPGRPDGAPLTEESPLRSLPAPHGASETPMFDNIEVEQAVRAVAFPVTVLRLPATHGPGDRQHRLYGYLRQMDDRRPTIVLEESLARWRWGRGYVENVAGAIALAVEDERSAGRVYNVAEPVAYSEAEWVRRIGGVAGWSGEVVAIPEADLPEQLRQPYDFSQDYAVDSTRIRKELDYREIVDEETALTRTIAWERANPPSDPPAPDYAAQDEALEGWEKRSFKAE
jgi:nucleoside-diphosphate-sugar epimerase